MNRQDNVLSIFFQDDENSVSEVQEATEMKEQQSPISDSETEVSEPVENEPTQESKLAINYEKDPAKSQEHKSEENKIGELAESVELVVQEDGQYSLFGDEAILSEPRTEEQLQKDEDNKTEKGSKSKSNRKKTSSNSVSKSSKASSSTTVTASKKKSQDILITDDWTVHYATHTFKVSDFVKTTKPSEEINLEVLRQSMEQEFFEMTKERTRWDYDLDNKRLFPDVIGTDKGGL